MIDAATEFTVRDAPGAGPDARLYRLACPHGVSSALRVGRGDAASDAFVLAVLLPGHRRSGRCGCGPAQPLATQLDGADPDRASVTPPEKLA